MNENMTTTQAAKELGYTRAWAVTLLRREEYPQAAPGGGFLWTAGAVDRIRRTIRKPGPVPAKEVKR